MIPGTYTGTSTPTESSSPKLLSHCINALEYYSSHFGFLACFFFWRSGRYNRQGRKAKNRRSRDSYSNRPYTRTQTLRNTGTRNLHLHLTRATIRTNDLDTLVHIGDLSPRQHRTARSSCQQVSTTTIHRPLTLDQRHAEFPMCTSQEGAFSHRWPAVTGCSNPAESVQVTDQGLR